MPFKAVSVSPSVFLKEGRGSVPLTHRVIENARNCRSSTDTALKNTPGGVTSPLSISSGASQKY